MYSKRSISIFSLITILSLAVFQEVYSSPVKLYPRQSSSSDGYTNPTNNGGSMLTRINPSSNLGEPLNVIISSNSDQNVLSSYETLSEYFASLYYSLGSCAGITIGGPQEANVGDGNGYVNQTEELRFNYYGGSGGTCLESIKGGNHFRYWRQNGSQADTNAIFIAASVELPGSEDHNIVSNGYDLGRDWLVGNATNSSGTISPGGFEYKTSMASVSLLQGISTNDINHGISVDGNVYILTVEITKNGTLGANRDVSASSGSSSSSNQNGAISASSISSRIIFTVLTISALLIIL